MKKIIAVDRWLTDAVGRGYVLPENARRLLLGNPDYSRQLQSGRLGYVTDRHMGTFITYTGFVIQENGLVKAQGLGATNYRFGATIRAGWFEDDNLANGTVTITNSNYTDIRVGQFDPDGILVSGTERFQCVGDPPIVWR